MQSTVVTLANLLGLLAGSLFYLLPGWLLVRRCKSPVPLVTAYLSSAVLLFHGILLLDSVGWKIDAGNLTLLFALTSAGLCYRMPWAKFRPSFTSNLISANDTLWLIPIALAATSIVARALIEPLPGYDNGTRWDYLARLFLTQHSLMGYPPVTSTDFERYSWCDGIPPLIPFLNLWGYLNSRTIAPVMSALRVVGEAALLGILVARLSRLLWGQRAGWAAVAALGSSSLALWSLMLGQETGVTAISLVAMIYFLELQHRSPRPHLVLWAAIAAGVGGLTREYALSFPLLGAAIIAVRQRSMRDCLLFAVIGFGIAAPWYARNLLMTGNPLYPQTAGGLLPGNPVHDQFMADIAQTWSLSRRPAAFYLATLLATITGLLVATGTIGIFRLGRQGAAAVAAVSLIALLWLWSIPQTAAGWVYSTRVLLPGLALLAALSGWINALSLRWRQLLLALILAATLDSVHRSWVLPNLPFVGPTPWSFADWKEIHDDTQQIGKNPLWTALVRAAAARRIVVDHTANHALITMRGGKAIALFSPALRPLFGVQPEPEAGLLQLRRLEVRFVVLSSANLWLRRAAEFPSFWSTLELKYKPLLKIDGLLVYDLDSMNKL